jgi:tetratricopeptide (TPR) repeat protein
MAEQPAMKISKIAIRVAAAGFGAALAGPLGCALGAAFGDALSGPLGEMIGKLVEEGGKEATKKLFDASGDTLAEKIQGSGGNLDAVYREALRQSLAAIRPQVSGYEDWFEHWELCLKAREVLRLDELRADQLTPEQLDVVLRRTLVRLDAQGAMMGNKTASIMLMERVMVNELDAALTRLTPGLFDRSFRTLIVSEEYEKAWKEAQIGFQEFVSSLVVSIKADTSALVSGVTLSNEKLDQLLALTVRRAEEDERIGRAEARALKAEAEANHWKRLALESVKADPPLEALLEAGNLDLAAVQKTEQLKRQGREYAKTYAELGRIHELRFDWTKALDAYQQAWMLEPSRINGVTYAQLARKQNRHKEAITVHETLRLRPESPRSAAATLNSLANLYRDTQRMAEAESAYDEALLMFRQLAKEDPKAYLPDMARILNNLANLYGGTQRMAEAELAYDEALLMFHPLAKENPKAYLPDVANTLNNLATLYGGTQRMGEAELAYDEALSIYRQLTEKNPEAYLSYVAMAVNNLANLYFYTNRNDEAQRMCRDAESILRPLWNANPTVHGDLMARILCILADVLVEREGSSEEACRLACEALRIAYDPKLQTVIQKLIARSCGDAGA